ncbi:choice-of-anchor Q domain-containing protein [Baekduia sp. Peel2402]|uniref:choice-of-anchor Q domain-containing protein n=1 Tax=Baekduia sp. Peel2402 TaxID=3458296 RepID=UPI00403E39E8
MRPLLATAALMLTFAAAPGADAATLTVDSGGDVLADDGRCTLREALLATAADEPRGGCAAGTGDGDVIVVAVPAVTLALPGFYEEGSQTGDLDVRGIVTIRGNGVTIDAAGLDRVLDVRPDGALTLEDATLRGGATPAGYTPTSSGVNGGVSAPGGGLRADGPTTLRRVAVLDNRTGDAGNAAGGSNPTNDVFANAGGRAGAGGGIAATAALVLERVTVARNRTGDGGDGGSAQAGTQAGVGALGLGGLGGRGGDGGGVHVLGPTTITDSTIVDNVAGDGGTGGDGHGGAGSGASSGTAGRGGDGEGGHGGQGGSGGGIFVEGSSIVTVSGSVLARNATGAGGVGGNGYGGGGANGTGTAAGGAGGSGAGEKGGSGGLGGGLMAYGNGSRSVRLLESTVVGNTTDGGGGGGNGYGAPGGRGASGYPGGNGGFGLAGSGGDAGSGGALAQDPEVTSPTVRVRGSTLARNAAPGTPGAPGSGSGGFGGNGSPPGSDGTAPSALPGFAGFGGIVAAAVEIQGSVVAENAPGQCSRIGAIAWTGVGNVVWPAGSDGCGASELVADPLLESALGVHGGATETLALKAGSPALDAVPATAGGACDATDQRGVPRPFGGACDAGAYERAAAGVVATGASGVTTVGATLGGTVDARRGKTTVHAEWPGGRSADIVVAAGTDGAVPVSFAATVLAPGTTYAYTLVGVGEDGTARSAPASFTTPATPGPGAGGSGGIKGGPPPITPVITKVKLSTATIAWTDSAPATTTIAFARKARGVRKGARCVAPPRKATKKKAKACTRYVTVKGTLRHVDVAGPNKVVWNGRLSGKRLAAGSYRVTLTPRLAGVSGKAVTKALVMKKAAAKRKR